MTPNIVYFERVPDGNDLTASFCLEKHDQESDRVDNCFYVGPFSKGITIKQRTMHSQLCFKLFTRFAQHPTVLSTVTEPTRSFDPHWQQNYDEGPDYEVDKHCAALALPSEILEPVDVPDWYLTEVLQFRIPKVPA